MKAERHLRRLESLRIKTENLDVSIATFMDIWKNITES